MTDKELKELIRIVQNTPSEHPIYTVLAEEIVKRIAPTIQSLLKQARWGKLVRQVSQMDINADKPFEVWYRSICCDASVHYDDALACDTCSQPCEIFGRVRYFDDEVL